MPGTNFNTLSLSEYETLRYHILLTLEEGNNPKYLPYADSEGIPTMGIGFNLFSQAAHQAVLTLFGFIMIVIIE